MSRIIFQDTYTIVLPSFGEVERHAHAMLHLFLGDGNCEIGVGDKMAAGNAVFVDGDTEHILKNNHGCKLFFLFDPTSDYAKMVKEQYLKGANHCVVNVPDNALLKDIGTKSECEILSIAQKILQGLFVPVEACVSQDERIETLIARIRNRSYVQKSTAEMADDLCMSESRLQHLFKETMGIRLKNYMLMKQVAYAYELVMEGHPITFAALEAGFSTPAHLAYTCKKYMGISVSNVLKR